MKPKQAILSFCSYCLNFALAALILLPIVWGVLLSLKTRVDALSTPPKWFFQPTLSNYHAAFIEGDYAGSVINSAIIAVGSTFIALALGIPAAYTFSRAHFKGYKSIFLSVLTVRMAPATVIALPLFLIFTKLGLIDSYIAIILVHAGVSVALVIWILKGFFDEVPVEVDEASLLDGDSRFGALVKQVLPLCSSGIVVTAAFCFINSWNEFFFALMLTGYDSRPFTVAVPALITPHGTYWGQVTAISTVGLLPGILFAFLARRYIVRELTAGAIWK